MIVKIIKTIKNLSISLWQAPNLLFANALLFAKQMNIPITINDNNWQGKMIKSPVIMPPMPYKMTIIETFKLKRYPR